MRYVRYADDFLVGVIGSKNDALELRDKIASFRDDQRKLRLSREKTKITHATTEKARFLGTLIRVTPHDLKPYRKVIRKDKTIMTRPATSPQLLAPIQEIVQKYKELGLVNPKTGRPTRWGRRIHFEPAKIITIYNRRRTSLLAYYSFASNYGRLAARVGYITKYSCALTFASKMRLRTVRKVFRKFGYNLTIKQDGKVLADRKDPGYTKPSKQFKVNYNRRDPMTRRRELAKVTARSLTVLNSPCSVCGSYEEVQRHHVRALKDIKGKKDYLSTRRIRRNRKQIPVCLSCHNKIHHNPEKVRGWKKGQVTNKN